MTNLKSPSSKGKKRIQNKVDRKHNVPIPKARQEVLLDAKNSFDTRKQKLQDETQGFMYAQSSMLSSVSRNLVFGIIGTIWVLTYVEGSLNFPNGWLFASLLVGLLFLFIDVIHYYMDSISYNKELYRLDSYKNDKDLETKHEPKMNSINKRSHCFIIAKFWILILASILFGIGLLMKTAVI